MLRLGDDTNSYDRVLIQAGSNNLTLQTGNWNRSFIFGGWLRATNNAGYKIDDGNDAHSVGFTRIRNINGKTYLRLYATYHSSPTGEAVLDSQGNFGIGTTSPFTKLSVAGNGYFDGSITASSLIATTSLQLPDGSAAAPALTFTNDTDTGLYRGGTDILHFVTAGQGRVTIDASGMWGLGPLTQGKSLR
ncbi:MAG: hypothetical protein KatS3mg099_127 [Candidatus Parcubacteria bacterium]|nr:MAG: hypothetical protein KatS3mg099_127 [Candidatus Parcubacteria bacterium]